MKHSVSLKKNIAANFAGHTSSLLLAVVFTPFYIELLGVEAYGLIGFYITLQASMGFLEMGLSLACNREIAIYSERVRRGDVHSIKHIQNTTRSLEFVYWLVAVLIGSVLTVVAPWVSSEWLKSEQISIEKIANIIIIMAWVIALRWPVGLYTGVMLGLQRQVMMNLMTVTVSLLNWLGAVAILVFVEASLTAFFLWQLAVSLFAALLFFTVAWKLLPGNFITASFSWPSLQKIMPFAAAVGANAILGTLIRQADKLILSALLPLKLYAVYTLVFLIASITPMLAEPVSKAVFPRFSQMVGACHTETDISHLYHISAQLVSILTISVAIVIAFFPGELLFAYTGDQFIATEGAIVLMILMIARMIHANMVIPYALQLAYGWVKLSVYINIASVIFMLPAIYFLTQSYGLIGAALAWFAVTLGYLFIGLPLMHRKLLKGEWWYWMKDDFILPVLVVTILVLGLSNWIDLNGLDRGEFMATLIFIGLVVLLITMMTFRFSRNLVLSVVRKKL